MNINDLKFLPQRLNNVQNSNQQRCYLENSASTDTFERSTSTVSFKGGQTKVAQTAAKTLAESAKDVLNNSEMLAKFGAFAAAAFAGLASLAAGKSDETTQVAETLLDAFNKAEQASIPSQEINSEIKNKDIDDDEIRVITPEYKEVVETTQEESLTEIQENIVSINVNENTDFVKVGFPKKHGRFSQEQIQLKNLVENYELPEDSANKLFELCEVAIKSKENTLEKYGFDTLFLTKQLPLHSETLEDCENFINNLYEQYKNPNTKVESETSPSTANIEATSNTQEISSELDEVYVPQGEQEVRVGTKVVGKIDVTGYKSYKQKCEEKVALAEAKAKEKIEVSSETTKVENVETENNVRKSKRARFTKTNPKEDFINTNIETVDDNREILHFKIPGTLEPNVKNNLTRLLLRFEDYLTENGKVRVKWMHRSPLSEKVLVDDIKQEILFRQGGDCPYRNITIEDAEDLAELIDGDYRFKELFTLHSALRLIDRFVNFDSDVPLEEQCSYAITKLYNALQKAMSNGVDIEVFEDFKHNAFAGRMVIEPDKNTNPEAFDIAGSYPIKITICENQDDPSGYQINRKLPLISTIFSKGL